MKFVAEFYLLKVKKIAQEIIEAEDVAGAVETAEGMETDYRVFVNIEEV